MDQRKAALLLDSLLDRDRKSTRLNSSHLVISYAVFCLKKKIKDLAGCCLLMMTQRGDLLPVIWLLAPLCPLPYPNSLVSCMLFSDLVLMTAIRNVSRT